MKTLAYYHRTLEVGTRFVKAKNIKKRIKAFELVDKKDQGSGIELADLIVSPIGRYVLGKRVREGHEILYSVVKEKFRKSKLEIFP